MRTPVRTTNDLPTPRSPGSAGCPHGWAKSTGCLPQFYADCVRRAETASALVPYARPRGHASGKRQASGCADTREVGARIRQSEVAARATTRHLRELADEFRERRLSLGLSQARASSAAAISRNHYAQLEAGRLPDVGLAVINRVAVVLGLDLSVRAYPGGLPIRDAAHSGRLAAFAGWIRAPLTCRVEVPLPITAGRWDRRAWDAMLYGHGERTAIELEMRLRDVQAARRRHDLKRRDDPTEQFLLLVADTRHNRRVLAEYEDMFNDLPRLRPSGVRAVVNAGRHPPTGFLLL